MELLGFSESQERRVTEEERDELSRLLGSLGLYDASLDQYNVTDHPEDNRWVTEGNNEREQHYQ